MSAPTVYGVTYRDIVVRFTTLAGAVRACGVYSSPEWARLPGGVGSVAVVASDGRGGWVAVQDGARSQGGAA